MQEPQKEKAKVGVSVLVKKGDRILQEESEVGWFSWHDLPQPLFLPLQHLLEGKTYPSQTTSDKIGSAIETSNILPRAEALEKVE